MKIYAIFANDNQQGTTYQLFNKAIEALTELGHEIDILNLYEREKEIPFFKHDRAYMESHPFYLENKDRFLQADQLLMVFPLFWYSVPGILKTWLDLINGWAYQYESGHYAKAKHNIKRVIVLYASMQDHDYMEQHINNPVEQQLKETCKFIGIDDINVYVVDNVTKVTPKDLENHLQQVKKMCK
ncbi:NAD(P)H-dependent oxidoreductase [Candidatus Babeliales bacterium]|nr:NAD(P)H-dependent oxidoreductase [Candidatus Babeliales bacterium]